MSENTVALVTGGSKGIGYAAALGLGRLGGMVIIGARDPERVRAAAASLRSAGVAAGAVALDVTDAESVAAAAKDIEERYGRLDVLVNNAGILLDHGQRPSEMPLDVLRDTYETNVFGVVTVTNAMLPLLRLAPAARIVNVSSSLGSLTRTSEVDSDYARYPLLAYNSSKAALNSVTVSYANELRDTAVKVNAVCPGYCATDLNGHSGPRSPEQGAGVVVRLATLGPDGPTGSFVDDDGTVPW